MYVACVLRTGGPYVDSDVLRLFDAVSRNLHQPFDFVCLTNSNTLKHPEVRIVPLLHNWPGWWSKLELFRTDIFKSCDQVLYVDLDTVILGDITPLAQAADPHPLVVLRDFYRPQQYGSGLLSFWGGNEPQIYNTFWRDPWDHIRKTGPRRGDQEFIQGTTPGAAFWQDIAPGKIVSYKVDCVQAGPPAEASIVCFHGKPKPGDVSDGWVRSYRDASWQMTGDRREECSR